VKCVDFHFRRAEIITAAQRKDVADTDYLDRFLIAWFWHRPTSADKNPIGHLIYAAQRMGRRNFMPSEAEVIIGASKRGRPLFKADDLGHYLRLTDAERTAWGIRTIGGPLPGRGWQSGSVGGRGSGGGLALMALIRPHLALFRPQYFSLFPSTK
jgi:hypothetical protein